MISMSCVHAFFFLALIFCFESEASGYGDVTLIKIVNGLKRGDEGRGSLSINGQQREIIVSDDVTMRIGSLVVSGFGLMDIIEGEKESVKCRFPLLSLTASVELQQPMMDASTSGEAMLRFLDAQLLVEALEGSLEEVTVRLESGATTMAFDLDNSLPMLQTELKAKREAIVSLFEKIVEDGIKDFIRRSEGENTELALAVPFAPESSVQKANRFIDQLLADNRKTLEDAIGVIVLPDEKFEFSKKILLVTTHGYAKLTKGRLFNLHALSRKGDCEIFAQNDTLNVVINLGLDNILGGYLIEVGFGILGATSDLKLKIESVQLIIKGLHSFREINDQQNPDESNILNFDLALNVKAHLGDIDVDVNIFGPLDWIINWIAEKVVSNLKGRLQGMIKDPIRDLIKGISGGKLKF